MVDLHTYDHHHVPCSRCDPVHVPLCCPRNPRFVLRPDSDLQNAGLGTLYRWRQSPEWALAPNQHLWNREWGMGMWFLSQQSSSLFRVLHAVEILYSGSVYHKFLFWFLRFVSESPLWKFHVMSITHYHWACMCSGISEVFQFLSTLTYVINMVLSCSGTILGSYSLNLFRMPGPSLFLG